MVGAYASALNRLSSPIARRRPPRSSRVGHHPTSPDAVAAVSGNPGEWRRLDSETFAVSQEIGMPKEILIAVDDSPPSRQAVLYMADLAAVIGNMRCTLVHVQPTISQLLVADP